MLCGTNSAKTAVTELNTPVFKNTDAHQYQTYTAELAYILSQNIHKEMVLESRKSKPLENFNNCDKDMKFASMKIAEGIQQIIAQTLRHKKSPITEEKFAHIISQSIVASIAQATADFAKKEQEGSLPAPIQRTDLPSTSRPEDYFLSDNIRNTHSLLPAPYDSLKDLKPFILDNSIRESTVAQQRGHVKADKYAILEAVRETGINNFIIASFGELPRVEDEWVAEIQASGQMKENYWAFTELRDDVIDGRPSADLPLGLKKIIQYQIPNCIIELDVGCKGTGWCEFGGAWTNEMHCELIKSRIVALKQNVSPNSKTLLNFRDGVKLYATLEGCKRIVDIVVYLAKQPADVRPLGICFEEPSGDAYPWQIRELCMIIRGAMNSNGWTDGHLLIHVHKNYGVAEAVVQEALANGCTGVWCGISEEGAGTGAAGSLMTMTNLARQGNTYVTETLNFQKLLHAAKEITFITSGTEPYPKQELYGRRAMDVLWNQEVMGVSEFDLNTFFDHPSPVRISTFTTTEMFRERLAQVFGNHVEDWDLETADNMRKQLHEDLLNGEKFDYQTPVGLYDLYLRAGGTRFLQDMVKTIAAKNDTQEARDKRDRMISDGDIVASDHPLLLMLRKMFDLYAGPDPDRLTYKNFFYAFINRFISCFNFPCPKFSAVVQAIDVDQSGDIDWPEMVIWAKWAIAEYRLTVENCDIDRLIHTIFIGHIFPIAFQNLYKVKPTSKKDVQLKFSDGDAE